MVKLAVIGGTGLYHPQMLTGETTEKVATPYGEVAVTMGSHRGVQVAFLARHGTGHTVPPHLINYRANIKALQMLGVEKIIATGAVGSLEIDFQPGDFVILTQFLDFTKNRIQTFYEGGDQGVVHVDLTDPYCPEIRDLLVTAAAKSGVPIKAREAVYVCTEGPRFETPAEIKMYQQLGAQVVGMTSVPEVILAREAEICYATIGMVTNYAAGISPNPLTHQEVIETMRQTQDKLRKILSAAIVAAGEYPRNCLCKKAVAELGKFT